MGPLRLLWAAGVWSVVQSQHVCEDTSTCDHSSLMQRRSEMSSIIPEAIVVTLPPLVYEVTQPPVYEVTPPPPDCSKCCRADMSLCDDATRAGCSHVGEVVGDGVTDDYRQVGNSYEYTDGAQPSCTTIGLACCNPEHPGEYTTDGCSACEDLILSPPDCSKCCQAEYYYDCPIIGCSDIQRATGYGFTDDSKQVGTFYTFGVYSSARSCEKHDTMCCDPDNPGEYTTEGCNECKNDISPPPDCSNCCLHGTDCDSGCAGIQEVVGDGVTDDYTKVGRSVTYDRGSSSCTTVHTQCCLPNPNADALQRLGCIACGKKMPPPQALPDCSKCCQADVSDCDWACSDMLFNLVPHGETDDYRKVGRSFTYDGGSSFPGSCTTVYNQCCPPEQNGDALQRLGCIACGRQMPPPQALPDCSKCCQADDSDCDWTGCSDMLFELPAHDFTDDYTQVGRSFTYDGGSSFPGSCKTVYYQCCPPEALLGADALQRLQCTACLNKMPPPEALPDCSKCCQADDCDCDSGCADILQAVRVDVTDDYTQVGRFFTYDGGSSFPGSCTTGHTQCCNPDAPGEYTTQGCIACSANKPPPCVPDHDPQCKSMWVHKGGHEADDQEDALTKYSSNHKCVEPMLKFTGLSKDDCALQCFLYKVQWVQYKVHGSSSMYMRENAPICTHFDWKSSKSGDNRRCHLCEETLEVGSNTKASVHTTADDSWSVFSLNVDLQALRL